MTDIIKECCDELEIIFKPLNEQVCSKCFENGKGCCKNCADCQGYFGFNIEKFGRQACEKELENLKEEYKFDTNLGFLDVANKNCKLPREKRSWTCLKYVCDKQEIVPSLGHISTMVGGRAGGLVKIVLNKRYEESKLI